MLSLMSQISRGRIKYSSSRDGMMTGSPTPTLWRSYGSNLISRTNPSPPNPSPPVGELSETLISETWPKDERQPDAASLNGRSTKSRRSWSGERRSPVENMKNLLFGAGLRCGEAFPSREASRRVCGVRG